MVNVSPIHLNGEKTIAEKILADIARLHEMGMLTDREASRAHSRMIRRVNTCLLKIRDGIDLDYETGAEK